MSTSNKQIAAANDKNFTRHMSGLKAPNKTAQGNALGMNVQPNSSPERATQKSRARFVVPLQGTSSCGLVTQGVALGFHVVALSARGTIGFSANAGIMTMANVLPRTKIFSTNSN